MKSICINKGGFGIASLFDKCSTVFELYQKPSMEGMYLEELGFEYKVGDVIMIKEESKIFPNTYSIIYCRVHKITNTEYECEFITQKEYRVNVIKQAHKYGMELTWKDPDPIPGNDYTITDIFNIDEDTALIHYGGGSEAEVPLSEIYIEYLQQVLQ